MNSGISRKILPSVDEYFIAFRAGADSARVLVFGISDGTRYNYETADKARAAVQEHRGELLKKGYTAADIFNKILPGEITDPRVLRALEHQTPVEAFLSSIRLVESLDLRVEE